MISSETTSGVTTYSGIDAIGDRLSQGSGASVAGWLIADLHGNIVAAASSGSSPAYLDAYRYDPYGETCGSWAASSGSLTVPWRFQGRILESDIGAGTDLYDFGARAYDPDLGDFTSFDTVSGSALNPLTLNRYLYASANPATLVDPDGHQVLSCGPDGIYCGYGKSFGDDDSSGSSSDSSGNGTRPLKPLHSRFIPIQDCFPRATGRGDPNQRMPPSWCPYSGGIWVDDGGDAQDGTWAIYTDSSGHLHYAYTYSTPDEDDGAGGWTHMEYTVDYDLGYGGDNGFQADVNSGTDGGLSLELPDSLGTLKLDAPDEKGGKWEGSIQAGPSFSVATNTTVLPNGDQLVQDSVTSYTAGLGFGGFETSVSYGTSSTVSGNGASIGVTATATWVYDRGPDIPEAVGAGASIVAAFVLSVLQEGTKDAEQVCSSNPDLCPPPVMP